MQQFCDVLKLEQALSHPSVEGQMPVILMLQAIEGQEELEGMIDIGRLNPLTTEMS